MSRITGLKSSAVTCRQNGTKVQVVLAHDGATLIVQHLPHDAV